MSNVAAPAKPSALSQLKALAQKKPAAEAPLLAAQQQDPALAGAKRDKYTVLLGLDPAFSAQAAEAAQLKAALERAQADFEILQSQVRDYGKGKRELYNDAFKADVTTVKVPYEVTTPAGPEKAFISVICSSKYSVSREIVLNNRPAMGEHFDKLFVVEETKELRPNAEELIRNVFAEMGLTGEDLEGAMSQLFEVKQKVSAAAGYEQAAKAAPGPVKAILDQAVTRAQPGLKF
jgi:hypothetical protein